MAIKKYTSGAWVPTNYRKYGTETDTITSLPVQIIGDGQPITSCQISGNTVQKGTPTPSDPVDVVGCGTWDETQQSYKLPPTVNGTEYPIYLGQVETTRKIRKYVFIGEESGTIYSTGTSRKGIEIDGIPGVIGGTADVAIQAICTHYQPYTRTELYRTTDNGISNAYQSNKIIFYDASYQTMEAFQQFCAQQYANGTPVTVWYVLATPETAVVNEPLMKIGDYADTVSATNIPTTGTAEQFDIQTTLKPSEVQLTYHGWHEHEDTKYTE